MARKWMTFSFDDGTVQDRRLVALLDRYGLKGTFNLNSGLFGQVHNIIHDGISVCHDEIAAAEVFQLYRDHEVAVHTLTHPNLLECSQEEVIRQVGEDARALSALTGREITGMAYPGGPFYNKEIMRTIVEHTPVRWARTVNCHHTFRLPDRWMEWHPTAYQNDADLMELADRFLRLETEEDQLFYLWGHSFEFDKYKSWDAFERFCEKIGGHGTVTYATNGEIFRWYQAKDAKKGLIFPRLSSIIEEGGACSCLNE